VAVLTPDSNSPRAVPCSDEDGPAVRGLSVGAEVDGREGKRAPADVLLLQDAGTTECADANGTPAACRDRMEVA
jgi:hypothetical protein